jgi:hypothetical protein
MINIFLKCLNATNTHNANLLHNFRTNVGIGGSIIVLTWWIHDFKLFNQRFRTNYVSWSYNMMCNLRDLQIQDLANLWCLKGTWIGGFGNELFSFIFFDIPCQGKSILLHLRHGMLLVVAKHFHQCSMSSHMESGYASKMVGQWLHTSIASSKWAKIVVW